MTEPLDADTVTAELARQTDLDACHGVFRRWLGAEYDTGSLDAVLAVAATHHLEGDPPWLLVISGSGNAKTETVMALAGVGAHITSTVTSEGALLSATPAKERTRGATGGLLRKIGDRGILVIKDFTSIISMNRDLRSSVLGALREVYDGRWDRSVGSDGARTLTWQGRIVLVGAVTTVYDTAHSVIASMGDRFALVRIDSTNGRLAAGRQALTNVGQETEMRADLSTAVAELMTHHFDPEHATLDDGDMTALLGVANLVTYARTAVERDYQGNVTDAHMPEMPTRFAKMLGQIVRGGLAVGMAHPRALGVAIRVAGDSMPPLRLALLLDVLAHPYSTTADVQKRVQKPRTTVDRELQALHLLGLLEQVQDEGRGWWRYVLSPAVDQTVLKTLDGRLDSGDISGDNSPGDISGDAESVTRNVMIGITGISSYLSSKIKKGEALQGAHEAQSEQDTVYPGSDKTGDRPLSDGSEGVTRNVTGGSPPFLLDEPLWPEEPDLCPYCGWPLDSVAHRTNCEPS